jgi:HEAT repeat protein
LCCLTPHAVWAESSGEALLSHFSSLTIYTPQDNTERDLIVGVNVRVEDGAYSPDGRFIALVTGEAGELEALPYPHVVVTERHTLHLLNRATWTLERLADIPDYYPYGSGERLLWAPDSRSVTVEYSKGAVTLPPEGGVSYTIVGQASVTHDLSGARIQAKEFPRNDEIFASSSQPPPAQRLLWPTTSFDGRWEGFATMTFNMPAAGFPDYLSPPTVGFSVKSVDAKEPQEIFSRVMDHGNVEHRVMPGHDPYIFTFQCGQDVYGVTPAINVTQLATIPDVTVFLDYSPTPSSVQAPWKLIGKTTSELPLSTRLFQEIAQAEVVLAVPAGDPAHDSAALRKVLQLHWGMLNVRKDLRAQVAGRLPLIRQHLQHPESEIRASAAGLFGEVGTATHAEPLLALLTDQESTVRRAAMSALVKLQDSRVLPALLELLGSDHESDRGTSAELMGQLGDRNAMGPLLAALKTETSPHVRERAAEALRFVGEYPILPDLQQLLDREQDMLVKDRLDGAMSRLRVTRRIDWGGFSWHGSAQTFRDQVEDRSAPIEPILEQLFTALQAPSVKLKDNAATSLGYLASERGLGEHRAYVVGRLIDLLHDQDLNTRWNAFHGLVGTVDASAVPLLAGRLATETDSFAKSCLQELLGQIRAPADQTSATADP